MNDKRIPFTDMHLHVCSMLTDGLDVTFNPTVIIETPEGDLYGRFLHTLGEQDGVMQLVIERYLPQPFLAGLPIQDVVPANKVYFQVETRGSFK